MIQNLRCMVAALDTADLCSKYILIFAFSTGTSASIPGSWLGVWVSFLDASGLLLKGRGPQIIFLPEGLKMSSVSLKADT